jgi:CheY-like chemotaxis protein
MNAATTDKPAQTKPGTDLAFRILVVDDDPDTVSTLVEVLRHEGHDARGVTDPRAVIEMAKALVPHVFVLDIGMPLLSGYSLAQQLRSLSLTHATALYIAISGQFTHPADAALSEAAGFQHHFVKPCHPSVILRAIRQWSTPPGGEDDA